VLWIIITIVIVGAFIVGAINRNTRVKIALEEQRRIDEQNSPENRAQATVSLRYFEHLGDVLDCKIRIAEHNIEIFSEPKHRWVSDVDESKARPLTKAEIDKALKQQIKEDEDLIKEIESDYLEKQKEYPNLSPEHLSVIKTKYELDAPFPITEDYFNEDNTSSWSMYVEKLNELEKLENLLARLKNPNTRELTLKKIKKDKQVDGGEVIDEDLFDKAVAIVVEENKASASLLQRRLRIGYAPAARMIEEMEKKGIVSPADGARPRQVLHDKK